MTRPPFAGARAVRAELPTEQPWMTEEERRRIRELPWLLRTAAEALARELGAPVVLDGPAEARWTIGPKAANPALAGEPEVTVGTLRLDRRRRWLVSDGPDVDGVFETFGQLRALARLPDGEHRVVDLDPRGAVACVRHEVADTWPSFALRGVDWRATCARWEARAEREGLPALRRWLAELGDAHTAIRDRAPRWRVPLDVEVRGTAAVLRGVPEDSVAWSAGARPGMALVGEAVAEAWETTGATPQQRPLLAGRRLLEGPPGGRELVARGPDGRRLAWTEPRVDPWGGTVEARVLPTGTGYLRVPVWSPRLAGAIDDAWRALADRPRWIVDLRGNGGGHLGLATAFRDGFLRERTALGTLRSTEPGGRLGPEQPLVGEPGDRRYGGRVRFLVDALTYSSSEDVLLGLQGLPHVELVGSTTGGGSGRVRTLRLLPGTTLTISSALTWDRRRRCVERDGLAPDLAVAPDPTGRRDLVLERADRW